MISIIDYLFEVNKNQDDITGKQAVKIALKKAGEHFIRNKGKYTIGAGLLGLAAGVKTGLADNHEMQIQNQRFLNTIEKHKEYFDKK